MSLLFGGLELPDAWQDRVADLVEQDSRSVDRKVERRRWEQRIARVRQGLIDGLLDTATTKKAITEAEAALAKLSETPHASIAAGSMLTDIGELWPHMTDEERHQLVRLILNEGVVDLKTGEVVRLLPKISFAPLFHILAEQEAG